MISTDGPGSGSRSPRARQLKPIIFDRLLITLQLAAGAAILWLMVGIPIGILSALRPRSIFDRFAMGFALFGVSTPVFFLGPVLLYIFWFKLGWLPGSGFYSIGQYGLTEWFMHMIMPWSVLALRVRRVLRADDPREPDRGHGRGLHPNRSSQGPVRTTGGA